MIYVCQACKGETHSRSDRRKPSTCDDCLAENPTSIGWKFTCACADVGHDQNKIPKIKPLPKSLENEIKDLVTPVREINIQRNGDAEKK